MSNIVCYSSDGSVLEYLNQWSTNQKLIIRGADLTAAPVFYFYNARIKEAIAVDSEIINNDIIVNIPDIMLQYEFPIIIDVDYSFSISEDFTIRIPIMPKAKPGDYIFDGTGGSGGSQRPSIEIVNNLTTDSPVAALSAAQGVVLKSMIDDVALNIDVEDQINEALMAAKDRGDFDGTGIVSVLRTEGSGQPGTTDTYTITLSDGSTSSFTVYNGKDGVNIEVDDENSVPLDVFLELQGRINDMQVQIGNTAVADQIQTAIENSGHITEDYVDEKIALLVDSAPETLNTLNELSEALGDDPNFATSIIKQLGSKVDIADGMGLSSNDYTDDDKNLLLSINERVGSVSVIDQINTAFSKIQTKAGLIYPLAGETVPDGFLLCDGKAYSRAEYPELFAVIGTTYGAGDGSTTFNVPNYVGRVLVGTGNGYALGATGGETSVKLSNSNIPQLSVWSDMYGEGSFLGHHVFESEDQTDPGFAPVDGFVGGQGYQRGYTLNVGTINNTAHNNMQPYAVSNYIIATGKGTGVSVQNIIMGAQALPLGVEYGGTGVTDAASAMSLLSAVHSGGDWKASKNGISCWKYEGNDVDEYDLPYEHCIVLVLKERPGRGTAIAFGWVNSDIRVWRNTLHDDTSSNKWGAWKLITDDNEVANAVINAITTTIPISKGGTGATDANTARSNLGLGNVSTENIVPIEKGGTGATNATQARESLGAAPANIFRYGTYTGDLNNVQVPGWWWIRCVDCTNTPRGNNIDGAYGYLEVVAPFGVNTEVLQRYTQYPDGRTWVRSSVNGWQPWVRVDSVDNAPMYNYGTTDLTAGSSSLETGKLYFVYE